MGNKVILSKKDWRECDGCGEKIKPVYWNRVWDDESNDMIDAEETEVDTDFMFPNTLINQLDGGLSFELVGGYDEFFDCMSEKDIIKINACHDCTKKLFALFPNKTKQLDSLHPSRYENDLCCDWAWSYDFGKEQLKYMSAGKIILEKQELTTYHKNEEGEWEK